MEKTRQSLEASVKVAEAETVGASVIEAEEGTTSGDRAASKFAVIAVSIDLETNG